MKRLILLPLLAALPCFANVGYKLHPPVVKENVELLTVALRLAGAMEYTSNRVAVYADATDEYFGGFKTHPTIEQLKELRNEHRLYFDRAMSFGLSMQIEDGRVTLDEELAGGLLDGKISPEGQEALLLWFDRFYRESDFNRFFQQHRDLYREATERFQEVVDQLELGWYADFYGEVPAGGGERNFYVVLNMLMQGNYGPGYFGEDGTEHYFAVLSTNATDEQGLPAYSLENAGVIVHEFNHPFCNPLIDKVYEDIKEQVEPAFELVREKLQRQAYGNAPTMIMEILVRACEVRYAMAQGAGEDAIASRIERELNRGFFWMEDLVALLAEYESDRAAYPSLESFMPAFVAYHHSPAFVERKQAEEKRNLEEQQAAREREAAIAHLRPRLIYVSVHETGGPVDPDTKEIVLRFSQNMNTGGRGFSYDGKVEDGAYPEITDIRWNETDKTELILSVELEPETVYSFSLFRDAYSSEEGYRMVEHGYIDFTTGKAAGPPQAKSPQR
jgi:hypothetical protein